MANKNLYKSVSAGVLSAVFCIELLSTPVSVQTYAPPEIKGMNPNAKVDLPTIQRDIDPSPHPSSRTHPQNDPVHQSPGVIFDLDHLALFLEDQIRAAAQTVIVWTGQLIITIWHSLKSFSN